MNEFSAWYESIKNDVDHMDALIKMPRSTDGECLFAELDGLIQWLARSAELVSIAESMFKQKISTIILEYSTKDLTPSLLVKVAEGICFEELKGYRRIERQNAGLVHAIEGIRTLLSYQKETMKMNNVNQGNKYDKK